MVVLFTFEVVLLRNILATLSVNASFLMAPSLYLISACVVLVSGHWDLVTADGVGEASGNLSFHLRLSFASEPRTRMSGNSSY